VHGQVDLYLDRTEKLDFVVWPKALGNNRQSYRNVFDLLTLRWLQLFIVFEMSGIVWACLWPKQLAAHPHATCHTPTPTPPTLRNVCRELLALFMI